MKTNTERIKTTDTTFLKFFIFYSPSLN